ncbi:MAG: hypothetical protein K9L85_04305, partial [Candidatus Peribacteraceae bacterium]|nr:hypothetical protein [Candidatus Peribacteraceae bacterium]
MKNVLEKNNLDLEIESRLDGIKFEPKLPHQREIYERMLFAQRNGIKIVLQAEMAKFIKTNPGASDAKLKEVAHEIIESCFAQLLELDDNQDEHLSYTEIVPENVKEKDFIERVFGTAPFFVAMENNKLFQNPRPSAELNVPQKIDFLRNYLREFSSTLLDPKIQEAIPGSGRELARLLQAISLSVVGGGFLKNEDFAEAFNKLLAEDSTVAAVFQEGKGKEQEKFGKLLEKDDVAIQRMRVEADEARAKLLALEKTNKNGHLVRRFGDIKSILLYYGSNLLFVTIGMNAVLSGFNPEKMLKNPVMWGMAGLIYAANKHLDPEAYRGLSPAQKDARESLKEKFQGIESESVRSWIEQFSSSDLEIEDGKLGKLLDQKGRSQISSAEIKQFVKKEEDQERLSSRY